MKHKHHIIPRYEGGSDDSFNLIELTVTQHAMWHFAEWQRKGNWQDKLAWKLISGSADADFEYKSAAGTLGGAVSGRGNVEEKRGWFGRDRETWSKDSSKGVESQRKNKVGWHDSTTQAELGKKGGKNMPIETRMENYCKGMGARYRCLVTGHESNAGGLARWQRFRGIDTNLREKVVIGNHHDKK
jgi:hypothetical protein